MGMITGEKASRTILVSNRLPITAGVDDGALQVERSVGGLATGLASATRASSTLWIGWPGPTGGLTRAQSAELNQRLVALDCLPVPLSGREVREYYEEISNGVLWPLFHYQADRLPLEVPHWSTYADVNARFAEAVAGAWRPGDDIWVHDYQLLLLPALLRRRLPEARIGFFLHIPFPDMEVFRILPWRREVLDGMLGADLIGFHTQPYARHFAASVEALLDIGSTDGHLEHEGRDVRIGAYPIGIDAEHFSGLAARPRTRADVDTLRGDAGMRLVLGVDRLDYTKGIPRRLLAYQHLLTHHPELHGNVQLIQVVVPSRTAVRTYREFRTHVDATIGHINGTFGTPAWTPVAYQYRSLGEDELSALYAAADVMFVTPVRDGMNLVAKEFIASRNDQDGVLVLSEFAGAAEELAEALLVNPYDVDGMAATLYSALMMPAPERRTRMTALRKRVSEGDSAWWARSFLTDLRAIKRRRRRPPSTVDSPPERVQEAVARARDAKSLLLLLDYDGTLVPFTDVPEATKPDPELLDLLGQLTALPHATLHVVSGRSREQLEDWLGRLPIALHAEHGLWSRAAGSDAWARQRLPAARPYDRLLAVMHEYAERTPGALVEQKSAGVAWHHRMADEALGEENATQLVTELRTMAAQHGVDVLRGSKVVEVRPRGIHKGVIAASVAARRPSGGLVLAMGDDRTDEDLFAALPRGSLAVHVGPRESRAAIRLADVPAARRFLKALLPAVDAES